MEEDPIQMLLESTGWSLTDLLKRVQKINNGSVKTEDLSPKVNLQHGTEAPHSKANKLESLAPPKAFLSCGESSRNQSLKAEGLSCSFNGRDRGLEQSQSDSVPTCNDSPNQSKQKEKVSGPNNIAGNCTELSSMQQDPQPSVPCDSNISSGVPNGSSEAEDLLLCDAQHENLNGKIVVNKKTDLSFMECNSKRTRSDLLDSSIHGKSQLENDTEELKCEEKKLEKVQSSSKGGNFTENCGRDSPTPDEAVTDSATPAEVATDFSSSEEATVSSTAAEVIKNSPTPSTPTEVTVSSTVAEVVRDSATPVGIVTGSSTPAEIVTHSSTPAEVVMDLSTPTGGVMASSSPAELISDSSTTAEVVADSSTPAGVVTDSTTSAEIVPDSSTPAEVKSDFSTRGEVVTDSTTPAVVVPDSSTPVNVVTNSPIRDTYQSGDGKGLVCEEKELEADQSNSKGHVDEVRCLKENGVFSPPAEVATKEKREEPSLEASKLIPTHDSGPKKKGSLRCRIQEQLELLRHNRKPSGSLLSAIEGKSSTAEENGKSTTVDSLRRSRRETVSSSLISRLSARITSSAQDITRDKPKRIFELLNIDAEEESSREESSELCDLVENNETEDSFGIRIIDVVGGYESPEPPEQPSPIKPTKTEDVTKIKGWKNKAFELPPKSPSKQHVFAKEPVTGSTSSDHTYSTPSVGSDPLSAEQQLNSAFVSDTLDKFLSENTNLRISYEVPKLKAQETITSVDETQPAVAVVNRRTEEQRSVRVVPKHSGNKAKTLAEKRKMLADKHNEELEWLERVENATEEQKQMYSEMNERLLTGDDPFSKRQFKVTSMFREKRNYVEYNNRRLKVTSKDERRVVARICMRKPELPKPSKISLLDALRKPAGVVSYKPGPLCKKGTLQVKKLECGWSTQLKRVPKLSLAVIPEFGRKVDPSVEHFIKFEENGRITDDQIRFALTALKDRDPRERKPFLFPVKFSGGQEQMVLLKSNQEVAATSGVRTEETEGQIRDAVHVVVAKLLDCAETSTVALDPIVEHCVDHEPVKEDLKIVASSYASNVKQKRLLCELRRLNCRYFEVDVSENSPAPTCTNEFCHMGCVCDSLKCDLADIQQLHCGRVACMFQCACGFNPVPAKKKLLLPPGADGAADTINKLQDEAVRNLARAEKEFTHTIVQAKNQTIILGSDSDNKIVRQKRATKAPKRYSESDSFGNRRSVPCEPPTKKRLISPLVKPCCVEMDRHNFDSIIPFCLVHNLYKCHCGYKAEVVHTADTEFVNCLEPSANVSVAEPIQGPLFDSYATEMPLLVRVEPGEMFKELSTGNDSQPPTLNKFYDNDKEYLPRSSRKAKTSEEAARLKPFRPKRKRANSSNPEPPVRKKPKANSAARKNSRSILKPIVTSEIIDIRPIASEEEHAADRKLRTALMSSGTRKKVLKANFEDKPDLIQEVRKMCGVNDTVDKTFRILKWERLLHAYRKGDLNIWYCNTQVQRLYISNIQPSGPFLNIRHLRDAPVSRIDNVMVQWLLSERLPEGDDTDNLFAIVRYAKPYYEIAGYCRKRRTSKSPEKEVVEPVYYSTVCRSLSDHCDYTKRQVPVEKTPERTTSDSAATECDEIFEFKEHDARVVPQNKETNKPKQDAPPQNETVIPIVDLGSQNMETDKPRQASPQNETTVPIVYLGLPDMETHKLGLAVPSLTETAIPIIDLCSETTETDTPEQAAPPQKETAIPIIDLCSENTETNTPVQAASPQNETTLPIVHLDSPDMETHKVGLAVPSQTDTTTPIIDLCSQNTDTNKSEQAALQNETNISIVYLGSPDMETHKPEQDVPPQNETAIPIGDLSSQNMETDKPEQAAPPQNEIDLGSQITETDKFKQDAPPQNETPIPIVDLGSQNMETDKSEQDVPPQNETPIPIIDHDSQNIETDKPEQAAPPHNEIDLGSENTQTDKSEQAAPPQTETAVPIIDPGSQNMETGKSERAAPPHNEIDLGSQNTETDKSEQAAPPQTETAIPIIDLGSQNTETDKPEQVAPPQSEPDIVIIDLDEIDTERPTSPVVVVIGDDPKEPQQPISNEEYPVRVRPRDGRRGRSGCDSFYRLQSFPSVTFKSVSGKTVTASVPSVGPPLRWFGLRIPEDFREMSVICNIFKLQQEDLQELGGVGKKRGATIHVTCKIIKRQRVNEQQFGIFMPQSTSNMLFVGPYAEQEHHAIYLFTDTYPSSNVAEKFGEWYTLVEKSKAAEPETQPAPESAIDLTADDDVQITTPAQAPTSNSDDDLMIVEEDQRSRERKYVITNIPKLGYLNGFQFENSKVVDIKCPFQQVTKRFSTLRAATAWLRRELRNRFKLLPNDLEITLQTTRFLPKGLSELPTHLEDGNVITRLGVKKASDLTDADLKRLGISRKEICDTSASATIDLDDSPTEEAAHDVPTSNPASEKCKFATASDKKKASRITVETPKTSEATQKKSVPMRNCKGAIRVKKHLVGKDT